MSFVLSGLYGENILTYRVDNVDNIILTFYFCEVRPLFLSTLTFFIYISIYGRCVRVRTSAITLTPLSLFNCLSLNNFLSWTSTR